MAEIPYRQFNPKSPTPWGTYFTSLTTYDVCSGIGAGAQPSNLSGLLTLQNARVNQLLASEPLVKADIPVDVTLLSGEGWLANGLQEADRIPLGETTEYAYTPPAFEPALPEGLDVDLDREADTVQFSEDGSEVEVYVDAPLRIAAGTAAKGARSAGHHRRRRILPEPAFPPVGGF